MQIHRLVALPIRAMFSEAGAASFDLDFAAGLLLNMLHVRSTLTDNLGSQVETLDRLKVDRNSLLGPFPLYQVIRTPNFIQAQVVTYPSKFITFNLRLFPTAESTFVYEVGQLLFHKLLNLRNGFIEALSGSAGNVEVKRRILSPNCQHQVIQVYPNSCKLTEGVAIDLSG
jgi:hypothetical protein